MPFISRLSRLCWQLTLWIVVIMVGAACGAQPTPRAILPPDRESQSQLPTPVPPTWREPELPITLANAPQIGYLGRLDSPQPNEGSLFAYAFSIDGTLLAGINQDFLMAWDLITGQLVLRTARLGAVDVFFSPDKVELYTLDANGFVRAFEAESGVQLDTFTSHQQYSGIYAFASEFGWLAVSGQTGEVRVWDVLERRATVALRTESVEVSALAFSADGEQLAIGSPDGKVSVWDWRTETMLHSFTLTNGVWVARLAFSPDGNQLAVGNDELITLWSLESGEFVAPLAIGEGGIDDVFAYSPDGRWLINGGSTETINLWEVETGRLLTALPNANRETLSAAFSPDGQLLVTAILLGDVALWDLSNPEAGIAQANLPVEDNILKVGWSPDGRTLALLETSGSVLIWGVAAPEATPTP